MNPATAIDIAHPSLANHLADAHRLSRTGLLLLAVGLLPILMWLSFAPLSSAVIAQAVVKVDLDRRPVQHAEGGLVSEVKVRDGQRVAQGDPLLVLGDVAVDADVNRLTLRAQMERASLARLESEQSGEAELVFATDIEQAAVADGRLDEQLRKERGLLKARRATLHAQMALLRMQRTKVAQEVEALHRQIDRAVESLRLQEAELETNRRLLQDGYVSGTRILQFESQVADYGVKLEERRSELARAEQRRLDIDLRLSGLEGEYRQQASDQLKVASARLAEIQQELRKASDVARRQVVTAPVSGVVMNMKYATPGSVVPPRETVADIVPINPRLVLEAHLRTEDVAEVREGQTVEIRLTAFNHRTTKLVDGRVFYVAADRTADRATQQAYYVALVDVDPASLHRAGEIQLQAGMPAEVYFQGAIGTPLQYLLAPLLQGLGRAARER